MVSEARNDGGPAFPGEDFALVLPEEYRNDPRIHALGRKVNGMTLRDYFAAKAMQAMLAAQIKALGDATIPNVAKDAYRMADGMLKARNQ